MQRRYNLAYFILAGVVVLGLTPLMVVVEAQAQIAFLSRRDGDAEIYVVDADGGNQRNLTNNRHDDYQPSWSPDGKRIVFVSVRDGNGEIYVMNADGKNQQRLTNNPHRDQHPSWSPDGKRIVFSARRDGHFRNVLGLTYEICVMDADGGNQQRLTENHGNDKSPSWSPDGKRIAFDSSRDGGSEIYVMDADGGINKDSLKIAVMTFSLHGPPTANGLPLRLIGISPPTLTSM